MPAASHAGTPCASMPAIIPASTSPAPAVASQGGALAAMVARPSGEATTVSDPFSNTTAPERSAAARTRSSFERPGCLLLMSLNSRGNSPSCGVSTTRQRIRVDYQMALRGQRSQYEVAGAGADTGARPDDTTIEALVAEQF